MWHAPRFARVGWLAVLLLACGAKQVSLPAPAVAVTYAAPIVTQSRIPQSPSAQATVTTAPAMPGLLDLAARAYGARLIVSVDIPAINVHSPVIAVGWTVKDGAEGQSETEWDSPGGLAGWVVTSALPGDGSNIILYGHNNLYASIFKNLGELKTGDQISLTTGEREWTYTVSRVLFLQTAFADQDQSKSYEKYLEPGAKELLTLISCWPPVSNTHRVIVLADREK